MRLILMRHGNTFEREETPKQVGARTDLPLTAFGKEQALRMRDYLLEKKITPRAIFAGPLKRHIESAEAIAAHFGMRIQTTSALSEIDYGKWEGLYSQEIQEQWPKEYDAWTKRGVWQEHIFNGSLASLRKELDAWLQTLRESFLENECVLAVTSNGLLRCFQNEKVKTGHFCELALSRGDWRVQSWNCAV